MASQRPRSPPTSKSPQKGAAADEDDAVWDGSEPGEGYETGTSRLNARERQLLHSISQARTADVEAEQELDPLPGLQKVITTGKELMSSKRHVFGPGVEATSAAVNSSGDTVAVGCRDSKLVLLDTASLSVMSTVDLNRSPDGTITSVQYKPDKEGGTQNVALVARADEILTVHTSTGKVLSARPEQGNKINVMQLRPDDACALATAGADTIVRVYDESTGQRCVQLDHGDDVNTTGHSNAVYGLAWVPDQPQLLVSGGWDRSVRVWDLRLQRAVRSIFGPYVCGDSVSVRGERVLTGSWRHSHALQQWDLGTGRLMTNMTFHQSEHEACLIYCAKFGTGTLDGIAYAGGSGKKPCLRTHQARGEVIGTLSLSTPVVDVAQLNHPAKKRALLVCCPDKLLHLDV